MISSDWDDWLLRAISEAEPAGVGIWYLGCNGFVLKDSAGTTLFIDPYLGIATPPRTIRMIPIPFSPSDVTNADAVFATHEHTDHVHGPSQAPIIENTDAPFYAPQASIDKARNEEAWEDHWDVPSSAFNTVEVGDVIGIGDFSITVADAHDADAIEPVSYVIEHPAGTVFHGGDTKPGPTFATLGEQFAIDLAIVAFGSVGNILDSDLEQRKRTKWYSNESEVVEIVNALQADRLLPSHWDMWKGLTADPASLHHHVTSWTYPRTLEIVEIGDRVNL